MFIQADLKIHQLPEVPRLLASGLGAGAWRGCWACGYGFAGRFSQAKPSDDRMPAWGGATEAVEESDLLGLGLGRARFLRTSLLQARIPALLPRWRGNGPAAWA